jgi:hypothetical protein
MFSVYFKISLDLFDIDLSIANQVKMLSTGTRSMPFETGSVRTQIRVRVPPILAVKMRAIRGKRGLAFLLRRIVWSAPLICSASIAWFQKAWVLCLWITRYTFFEDGVVWDDVRTAL